MSTFPLPTETKFCPSNRGKMEKLILPENFNKTSLK